jgi:Tfp pilus assembly ATPase PilU
MSAEREPIDHQELGQTLADIIDQLESQRIFTGDLECTFVLPLDDGTEYRVTVMREPKP